MLDRLIPILFLVIMVFLNSCGNGDFAPNYINHDTITYSIKYNNGKLTPNLFEYTVRTKTDTSFIASVSVINPKVINWFNSGDTIGAIYADSLSIIFNSHKMALHTYVRKGLRYGYFVRP